MNYQVMDIKAETYEEPAKLYLYLQENLPEIAMDKRPLIFICPGGAYAMTSDREAEAVALQFLAAGFHAAVLRYSVAPARYPTALLQVAAGFKYLREHAEEFHIDEDKIVIQGASAGGHLAASYGVFWKKKDLFGRDASYHAGAVKAKRHDAELSGHYFRTKSPQRFF